MTVSEKWQREIERIQQSVVHLADYRRWNRVYERVANAHPKLRPAIPTLDYFRNVYGDYAAMAVRRQGRHHRDSVSLLGFLEDLAANASFITRDWSRSMYREPIAATGGTVLPGGFADSLADKDFKKFAGSTGLVLDAQKVLKDVAKLKLATGKIVALTDTAIAHDVRKGPEFQVTFDDLNVGVDCLEELTRKYDLLFTGASMLSMTPIDTTNAITVFDFPWIDPNNRPDPIRSIFFSLDLHFTARSMERIQLNDGRLAVRLTPLVALTQAHHFGERAPPYTPATAESAVSMWVEER